MLLVLQHHQVVLVAERVCRLQQALVDGSILHVGLRVVAHVLLGVGERVLLILLLEVVAMLVLGGLRLQAGGRSTAEGALARFCTGGGGGARAPALVGHARHMRVGLGLCCWLWSAIICAGCLGCLQQRLGPADPQN